MAREYASIKLLIWQDDEFRSLSREAQHLYLLLVTHPSLSYCGVVDWRPARLAAFAGNITADDVIEAAEELRAISFVVVDEETEEALVRSFIRNDGLMKQPRMAISMVKAYAAVASRTLQGVVIHELQRLHKESPELNGWHKQEALDLLTHKAIDPRDLAQTGESLPQTLGNVSETFGPNKNRVLLTPATAPKHHAPGTTIQDNPKAATPSRAARATRIPDDFTITDDMRKWARTEVPGLDIDRATKKFVLHFQSASGQRATMLNWQAAWKKWMHGDHERGASQTKQPPATNGSRPGIPGVGMAMQI